MSNEFFEDEALIIPVLEGGQAVQELAIETKELEKPYRALLRRQRDTPTQLRGRRGAISPPPKAHSS